MFKKILLAFDGSEPAKKAFDRCLEMSRSFGAQMHVVAVVRPPEFAEEVETKALIETGRNQYSAQLERLKSLADAAGVHLTAQTRVGHPAEQIIAAAEEWQADLIVTGHRGRGLFERWLLGSVSRLVIAYAHCAVLVIR